MQEYKEQNSMKKTLALILVLVLIVAMAACGAQPKNSEDTTLFTDEEIGQISEDNGENGDAQTPDELAAAFSGGSVQGLPDGFPQSVPLYEGAELLEADTYGDNGYTVVYRVDAPYEMVVAFYMQAIPGMDESGIGNDESYFEAIDMEDGVHINGLTISDADGTTQVFITLKGGSSKSEANDEMSYDDESYDDNNEAMPDYDSITGSTLEDGYPEDVIPLYSGFKIVDSSKTPDNDLYILDGVAPTGSYNDVLAFYNQALGTEPDRFDSQIMTTDNFTGEIDGWSYSVYLAVMKADDSVMFHISMQK
jgi:hypothetical protein